MLATVKQASNKKVFYILYIIIMNLEKFIEKKAVENTVEDIIDYVLLLQEELKDYIETYNICIWLEDKKAFKIIEKIFWKYWKVFFYSNTREFKKRLLEEIWSLNCYINLYNKILDYKKQNEEPKNNK